MFILFATSCLKETSLPIDLSFEYQFIENNQTSPVEIVIQNQTKGADFYEWTFEGATPNTSSDKNPPPIFYNKAGKYLVKLKAWNGVSSAEKEIEVRIDSALSIDFDYNIEINNYVPAEVKIANKTKGAIRYEWRFEGGMPSSSDSPNPGTIKYNHAGEHKIHLKVSNGSKEFELTKMFTLQLSPLPDFEIAPSLVDNDMEAPFSAILTYKPEPNMTYKWECAGATITNGLSPHEAIIRFLNHGTYTVKLIADNKKEIQLKEKQIVLKPNSGIYHFKGVKFGISEAKYSIGCFFSASHRQTLTPKELVDLGENNKVDFGFFGINSSFEYCYFFSPDKSEDAGFDKILLAQPVSIVNLPEKNGIVFTNQHFENINTADDFSSIQIGIGKPLDYFDSKSTPLFILFETADKRKGAIRVNSFNRHGIGSYILTDIKIEKREGE